MEKAKVTVVREQQKRQRAHHRRLQTKKGRTKKGRTKEGFGQFECGTREKGREGSKGYSMCVYLQEIGRAVRIRLALLEISQIPKSSVSK